MENDLFKQLLASIPTESLQARNTLVSLPLHRRKWFLYTATARFRYLSSCDQRKLALALQQSANVFPPRDLQQTIRRMLRGDFKPRLDDDAVAMLRLIYSHAQWKRAELALALKPEIQSHIQNPEIRETPGNAEQQDRLEQPRLKKAKVALLSDNEIRGATILGDWFRLEPTTRRSMNIDHAILVVLGSRNPGMLIREFGKTLDLGSKSVLDPLGEFMSRFIVVYDTEEQRKQQEKILVATSNTERIIKAIMSLLVIPSLYDMTVPATRFFLQGLVSLTQRSHDSVLESLFDDPVLLTALNAPKFEIVKRLVSMVADVNISLDLIYRFVFEHHDGHDGAGCKIAQPQFQPQPQPWIASAVWNDYLVGVVLLLIVKLDLVMQRLVAQPGDESFVRISYIVKELVFGMRRHVAELKKSFKFGQLVVNVVKKFPLFMHEFRGDVEEILSAMDPMVSRNAYKVLEAQSTKLDELKQ